MVIEELASVDGVIGPTAHATIPLRDDGLYRGDGVFEVIRLYDGHPFALQEHLDRLERSAAAISLTIDRPGLEDDLEALFERFGPNDAQLRIIMTRGGRRLAMTEQLPKLPATVRLATIAYSPTLILNGVKSLSYGANMHATRIAQERGADEALLVRPDGIVLEAPTSTIFWVSPEGGLRTPAISAGILESITRARIVDALHVEEAEFHIDDLHAAHEAFLASTVREVQPIVDVDGRSFEGPGPRTAAAKEAFERTILEATA